MHHNWCKRQSKNYANLGTLRQVTHEMRMTKYNVHKTVEWLVRGKSVGEHVIGTVIKEEDVDSEKSS